MGVPNYGENSGQVLEGADFISHVSGASLCCFVCFVLDACLTSRRKLRFFAKKLKNCKKNRKNRKWPKKSQKSRWSRVAWQWVPPRARRSKLSATSESLPACDSKSTFWSTVTENDPDRPGPRGGHSTAPSKKKWSRRARGCHSGG